MRLYSNEIVFREHPNKVYDQISDALLDAYLKDDPFSHYGIEVVGVPTTRKPLASVIFK